MINFDSDFVKVVITKMVFVINVIKMINLEEQEIDLKKRSKVKHFEGLVNFFELIVIKDLRFLILFNFHDFNLIYSNFFINEQISIKKRK